MADQSNLAGNSSGALSKNAVVNILLISIEALMEIKIPLNDVSSSNLARSCLRGTEKIENFIVFGERENFIFRYEPEH